MKKIIALSLVILILTGALLSACSAFPSEKASESTENKIPDNAEPDGEQKQALRFPDMPQIRIDCENGASVTSKEEYVKCDVSVLNCPEEFSMSEASAGIRTRGNSTSHNGDPVYALYNQVPYRIKFDKKQSMLGLNDGAKCKSWVLLLPTPNHAWAFTMGQYIMTDAGYYCSDSQYVELYLNGQYKGVYILAEQSQINENRVDVFETPEGYTSKYTGYFLELNNYPEKDDFDFYTNFHDVPLSDLEGGRLSHAFNVAGENIHTRCYTIKNDNVSPEQDKFIERYINAMFSISYNAIVNNAFYEFDFESESLYASTENDAKALIGKYIDLDSLVNMYLMQEISMNTDVGAGSFYLSVDLSESGNKKLTFECPWDFDWGFSGTSRYVGEKYEGLCAATFCPESFAGGYSNKDRSNPWLILFMNAKWFRNMVYERFCELDESGAFEKTLEESKLWLQNYSEQFNKNKEKWNTIDINWRIIDNRQWFKNRIDWLKVKFKSLI